MVEFAFHKLPLHVNEVLSRRHIDGVMEQCGGATLVHRHAAVIGMVEEFLMALQEGVAPGGDALVHDGDAGAQRVVAHVVGEVCHEGSVLRQALCHVAHAEDNKVHGLLHVGGDRLTVEGFVVGGGCAHLAQHVLRPEVGHSESIDLELVVDALVEV